MEVGALARQAVDGRPLIRDALNYSGSNVQNRAPTTWNFSPRGRYHNKPAT